MAIVTHYVRRDLSPAGYTAAYVYNHMPLGQHVLVLYEPNDFDADWRLVTFRIIQEWNVRTGVYDRKLVVIEEQTFDDDPRKKIA